MDEIGWIRDGLKQEGKSKSGLAKAMGVWPSAVSSLLAGTRQLKVGEAKAAAAYLGVEGPRRVKLVGYVGAGAHYVPFEPTEMGEVDAPEGATEKTVAAIIRGTSLGIVFDGWLVFYDEIFDPPTSALAGSLCVIGAGEEGESIMVKLLQPTADEKIWHLFSNEAPMLNVKVAWAARVKQMSPR